MCKRIFHCGKIEGVAATLVDPVNLPMNGAAQHIIFSQGPERRRAPGHRNTHITISGCVLGWRGWFASVPLHGKHPPKQTFGMQKSRRNIMGTFSFGFCGKIMIAGLLQTYLRAGDFFLTCRLRDVCACVNFC